MDDNDNDIDLQLQPPWLSRSFGGTQQDAKLRTVERHVRRLDRHRPHPEPRLPVVESTPSALSSTGTSSSSSSNRSTSSSSSTRCMVVIPNARVWRKYWRLIRAMVVDEDAAAFVATAESTTNDTKSNNDNNTSWQWILTESAVECMDHRHQSLGEQTVGSERSALLRLVRDHCHQHHQPLPNTSLSSRRHSPFPRVMPMADLSMRNTTTTTTTNYDCWDCFGMQNWTIEEQSRHAQIRAATLVLEQHHQEQNHHPREDVEVCCCCWLLVDDDNDNDTRVLLPLPEVTTATNTIQYGTMADLLRAYSNISSSNSTPLLSRRMDPWYDLERLCAHEYRQRNPPAVHRDNTGEAGIRRSTTTSSSTSRDKEDARSDAFSYNNYSADDIALGLRHGRFIRGRLTVPLENVQEAYVTSSSSSTLTTTWFVPLEYRHGALHQDTVLVQVLPESQWCRPVGRRRLVFMAATTTTTSPMTEDEEEHKTPESKAIRDLSSSTNNSGTEAVPTARVVWVEQTHRRVFVATLVAPPDHNNAVSSVLVVPMDLRIPKIRIRTRSWRNWHGQRLKVQILTTSSSLSLDDEAPSKYPMGHCLEILGPIGDVEVEIQSLLIENQVDLEPFSVAALACLPTAGNEWRVSDKDLQDRRDLRTSRRIFSVDPPGCQDIDDTMHAEVLPNGDVESKCVCVFVWRGGVYGSWPHFRSSNTVSKVTNVRLFLFLLQLAYTLPT